MKIRKCSHKDCDNDRMKKPGNTTLYFKYCMAHQIEATMSKVKQDIQKDKEGLENARKTIKKQSSRDRFYKSMAWKYFSHWILLKYADEDLEVRCATNPLLKYRINDKRICVGHWQKVFDANSSNYSVAFDERNVLPQSVQENIHKSGNMEEMAKAINIIHGKGTTDILLQLKKLPVKLDIVTMKELAEEYKARFKAELKRRNIKDPWK